MKALNPGGSVPMYSEVLEVRFRVDDQPQRRALLEPEYSNVAKWQSATDLGGAMRQGALALQGYSAFDELPTRRLLIADAFPGEVVEFSFETMALDEWSAVQRFCFLPRSTDEAADAEEGH